MNKSVIFSIKAQQICVVCQPGSGFGSKPNNHTWTCKFGIHLSFFLALCFSPALNPVNTVTLSSMYRTTHTLTARLCSWSNSYTYCIKPPCLSFSVTYLASSYWIFIPSCHHLFSFISSLSLSVSVSDSCSLPPQWWVIKVVRAIPLPRGWETYSKAAEIKMKTN